MRFAVMGNPIAHSLSPLLHHAFARAAGVSLGYEACEVVPDALEAAVIDFFAAGGAGLNMTAPFKQRAFAMAERPTARATLAKAANTLWMHEGVLCADTTDGVGFQRDMARFVDLRDKSVLLLGAGGAARSIWAALLSEQPKQVMVANRTLEHARALPGVTAFCTLSDIQGSFDVILNSLPVNFANYACILSSCMENLPFCYDLNYASPGVTPFVAFARAHHVKVVDGLGMLVEQAVESFLIWQAALRPLCLT